MDNIFIQIAAYRDPQLLPTLRDCISKASSPENLVFSIAWQHCKSDKWDNLDEFINDARFKIIDISHENSKGACWARNLLQQQYDGEMYTLQLDSHHRFIESWDKELILMLKQLQSKGYKKPLLTGYLPPFHTSTAPRGDHTKPLTMVFEKFTPAGAVLFNCYYIPAAMVATAPIPAGFYAAHFCFTSGEFCREVQHDPQYYFYGEEISIAARAYTHGYDLFHPHQNVVFHLYSRKGRRKHWEDHLEWDALDKSSAARNRILLGMEPGSVDFGIYGLGTARTFHDYEIYSGINFESRTHKSKAVFST